jgi:WD40 repeat protein
MDINSSN